jgi:cytochrome c551/c552
MEIVLHVLTALTLASCGAAKAARDTGQIFDKYGCVARDSKGEPACKTDGIPRYH